MCTALLWCRRIRISDNDSHWKSYSITLPKLFAQIVDIRWPVLAAAIRIELHEYAPDECGNLKASRCTDRTETSIHCRYPIHNKQNCQLHRTRNRSKTLSTQFLNRRRPLCRWCFNSHISGTSGMLETRQWQFRPIIVTIIIEFVHKFWIVIGPHRGMH